MSRLPSSVPVFAASLLAAASTCACKGATTHYDDIANTTAERGILGCARPAQNTLRACAALTQFDSAGPLDPWPEEGQLFFGYSDCPLGPHDIGLEVWRFSSASTAEPDVDPARRPAGSILKSEHHLRVSLAFQRAADATLSSAKAGLAAPNYQVPLSDDEQRQVSSVFHSSWSAWLGATSPRERLATSSGASLLVSPGSNPAWWDDAKRLEAHSFIRMASDGHLVELRPDKAHQPGGAAAGSTKPSVCVLELWPVP